MSPNYTKIELTAYSSIKCNVLVNQDGTVLVLAFAGNYRAGSDGNGDGLFMCAMTAAYCAMLEPASLVLDLSDLNYKWGNTILKTVNYFWEHGKDPDEQQKLLVVVSNNETRKALDALEMQIRSGNRAYADTIEHGIYQAEKAADQYLA